MLCFSPISARPKGWSISKKQMPRRRSSSHSLPLRVTKSTSPRARRLSYRVISKKSGALWEGFKSPTMEEPGQTIRNKPHIAKSKYLLGLSLFGVEPLEPWVQFGSLLQLQHFLEPQPELRLPPRLVGLTSPVLRLRARVLVILQGRGNPSPAQRCKNSDDPVL